MRVNNWTDYIQTKHLVVDWPSEARSSLQEQRWGILFFFEGGIAGRKRGALAVTSIADQGKAQIDSEGFLKLLSGNDRIIDPHQQFRNAYRTERRKSILIVRLFAGLS